MLLLGNRPVLRLVIGAVVLALGVAMHKALLDVTGGAVMLLGAGQWLQAARRR